MKGAFLISASCNGTGAVHDPVEIVSEAGLTVTLEHPWPASRVAVLGPGGSVVATEEGRFIRFETVPGEAYSISPRV